MTKPADDDKRHPFGARGLGAVLPDVVRPAFRKRNPSVAHLAADWSAVVGPTLAAVTAPKRLFQGTLSISASGPVAMELQHLSAPLLQRINTHLGGTAVTRLRFVQDFSAAVTTLPMPPARLAANEAAEAVRGLPAGELRDALERLGQRVLAVR